MKKADYIIVGFGLAAVAFCELLERKGKTFVVIDDDKNYSSKVSGGLYNPVILKRFTLSWNAEQQLALALPMYKRLEQKLHVTFDHSMTVMRKFTSIEDQNNWLVASDAPNLQVYMDDQLVKNHNAAVIAPFGFGRVKHTGKIDTQALLSHYKAYLEQKEMFITAPFQHELLDVDSLEYKGLKAKKVVFTEGYGMHQNIWFANKALKGNKGELLLIEAADLNLDFVIKSNVFIIPVGDNQYTVGATYDWQDKTVSPTVAGKEKLLRALDGLISCNYKVIEHRVGIRPTVADRRPIVGTHPLHPKLAVLNGLGTRGVMIGPTVADQLYKHLEEGEAIPPEIDFRRFYRI
jgi:glycine/D-amino acid oxidase-like deaminating enzyme